MSTQIRCNTVMLQAFEVFGEKLKQSIRNLVEDDFQFTTDLAYPLSDGRVLKLNVSKHGFDKGVSLFIGIDGLFLINPVCVTVFMPKALAIRHVESQTPLRQIVELPEVFNLELDPWELNHNGRIWESPDEWPSDAPSGIKANFAKGFGQYFDYEI